MAMKVVTHHAPDRRAGRVPGRLQDANRYAADQAAEYTTVRDRYRDWQRAQEQASEPAEGECDE